MVRILTQAEIDLCGQFAAFMASLIEGPVKSVDVSRFGKTLFVHTSADGSVIHQGKGVTLADRIGSSLAANYAAEANKAETLKSRIADMQAQLQELEA